MTFADILREVRNAPPTPSPPRDVPGLYPDGVIVDHSARIYSCVAEDISASRALDLAGSGAAVVWDPCGCGGYCGLVWFDAAEVAEMVASGLPNIRRTKKARGNVSEWQADDGAVLLLAEDAVRWGALMK